MLWAPCTGPRYVLDEIWYVLHSECLPLLVARGLLAVETTTLHLPRESPYKEATRYLSAATQLDIWYAEAVVREVMNERFKALAPTFGVDVPVVARWAIKALRTRARRDYMLAGILLGILIAVALTFLSLELLVAIPVLVMVAWMVVSREIWERLHNTVTRKMLRGRFDPSDAPDLQREADRRRLDEVAERADGNLVVFSGHFAFIGSGKRLYGRRLLLDVSRGKDADDGTARDPEPFSSQDLHTALIEAFGNEVGLGKNLDNVRVYERLFVNGLHVQNNKKLLPHPLYPPPSNVDMDLLEEAARHPTAEARTYVCVEMTGWQGQLVVTLFVRAVHANGSLYVEWTFRVLPPLMERFLQIDDFYEFYRHRQVRHALRHGLSEMPLALIGSPLQAFRNVRRPHSERRHAELQARAIQRGSVFDYGAHESIREQACGWKRRHYFLARDETMYVLLAQQTLTRTIRGFLGKHGVALAQFDEQIKIINNSININGNVTGTGINVGNNSTATVSGPQEATT